MNKQRILSASLALALTAVVVVPASADLIQKQLTIDSGLDLYVDGKQVQPVDVNDKPVDVFAADGTTYLPIRTISEKLGAQIVYGNGASNRVYIDTAPVDKKATEYLQTYFGISPIVRKDAFLRALAQIFDQASSQSAGPESAFSVGEAVQLTVESCGLKELALTYSAEKSSNAIAGCSKVQNSYLPYIACALDTSLASGTWDFSAQLTSDVAAQLLMNAANLAGKGRNFLGNSTDADIYSKLHAAWNSFTNFDDPKLSELGAQLVLQEASTGYNLKYDGYDANFLPDYTLKYGHSDIDHAIQLVGLLSSENMDVKVQLEPKVSIYEYLTEWGDPTKVKTTPTYQLREIEGGRWLCYAMEYDLMLEFDTTAEKEKFHTVVEQYAKKYDDRVDADGNVTAALLTGSWWQPLYSSSVPMENAEFQLLKDNVITDGHYSIHPFSVPEDTAKIEAVVKKEAPDLKVEAVDLYVNPAFYRYITGTGKD